LQIDRRHGILSRKGSNLYGGLSGEYRVIYSNSRWRSNRLKMGLFLEVVS
jgi:hypothetical protein